LECVSELLLNGAKVGISAKACDDVELHYAAAGKNWNIKVVQQVRFCLLLFVHTMSSIDMVEGTESVAGSVGQSLCLDTIDTASLVRSASQPVQLCRLNDTCQLEDSLLEYSSLCTPGQPANIHASRLCSTKTCVLCPLLIPDSAGFAVLLSFAAMLQLIDAGCPLNTYNGAKGAGCTPLTLAASKGQTKVS
jgi:hypothetical protein